jgi:hypothetical protein
MRGAPVKDSSPHATTPWSRRNSPCQASRAAHNCDEREGERVCGAGGGGAGFAQPWHSKRSELQKCTSPSAGRAPASRPRRRCVSAGSRAVRCSASLNRHEKALPNQVVGQASVCGREGPGFAPSIRHEGLEGAGECCADPCGLLMGVGDPRASRMALWARIAACGVRPG